MRNPGSSKLLVGMTGSIHSALIFMYLQDLQERVAGEITFVLTQSATEMVSVPALKVMAPNRVFTDPWDSSQEVPSPLHVQLAQRADAFLVLPASANVIGKAAHGIADDLLTTLVIAYQGPIVFAPAMNIAMWSNRAVQRNVQRLKDDGHVFAHGEPDVELRSGESVEGIGPTPAVVVDALLSVLNQCRGFEPALDDAPSDR